MTTKTLSQAAATDEAQSGLPLLTTEAALADPDCAAAIDAFWHGAGRFGRFVGNRGLQLAFATFVQPDPTSERGAIVIVSGRTESLLKYPEVAYDLWRNGYSVYLYDHRGQGLSDREPAVASAADRERGHVGRFDDYVDDLRTFIGTQVAPAGHRAHFLIAHSMGGAVTALLLEDAAAEATTFFRAAALLSPMLAIAGPGGWPFGGWAADLTRTAAALGLATRYVPSSGGYTASSFEGNVFTHSAIRYARWRAAYEREPQAKLGGPTVGWLAATCAAMERARSHADRIRVPVRVIAAGNDAIVHPSGIAAFCAGLGASATHDPAAAVDVPNPLTIGGARHEMLIESDAVRSRALGEVLRFFAQHA